MTLKKGKIYCYKCRTTYSISRLDRVVYWIWDKIRWVGAILFWLLAFILVCGAMSGIMQNIIN